MIKTRIETVNPCDLKPLETNARYMRHEEFQRLVSNIKRDGQLTSAPFCARDEDGRYTILSGNHRVKAAIEAGLEEIPAILTDDELSEEQRIAIQLSHNSIVGQDDPDTLKKLYDRILDVDLKEYSGLDDKTLGLLDKASAAAMSEANLDFQTLSIVFLPDEMKEAARVIEDAKKAVSGSDEVWLALDKQYDQWLDDQEIASSSYNIKNVAASMQVVMEVFERNLTQLAEGWTDSTDKQQWVPLSTIMGRTKIPVTTAKTVKKAIDKMVGSEVIAGKERWKALEIWAQNYLDS